MTGLDRPRVCLALAWLAVGSGCAQGGEDQRPASVHSTLKDSAPLPNVPRSWSPRGRCDRVTAPTGSDKAGYGTRRRPFRTVTRLVQGLRPGETGCVRAGTYRENVSLRAGGASGARLILRSYPGERARLIGQLILWAGATHVTVAYLDLQGTGRPRLRPSPVITGNRARFVGNNVSSPRGNCFYLGEGVTGTVIRANRVHGCGRRGSNLLHGVYLARSRDTLIAGNLIHDNADRGIQLYPNALRTTIRHNVIDGNGEGIIFSGEGGVASSDTLVKANIITFSALRYDVESYYEPGAAVGERNAVRRNCIHGGALGAVKSPQVGFTARDNILADPGYARSGPRYKLRSDSPCRVLFQR